MFTTNKPADLSAIKAREASLETAAANAESKKI
jgi:hypothetical protein